MQPGRWIGSAVYLNLLVPLITWLGWWRPVMVQERPSGPARTIFARARLDARPLASGYLGGIPTRCMTRPCLDAPGLDAFAREKSCKRYLPN